jgi:hypothetical protein
MLFKSDNYPKTRYTYDETVRIMNALDDIVGKIEKKVCVCCGKRLDITHVDMYDHDGGWIVTNDIPKQWLSVHCDHCNYDISLNKLGVSRYGTFRETL